MRTITTEGLEQLGYGGTCTVFALDGSSVLKAFRADMPEGNVVGEWGRARAAWEAGVPSAEPCGLVAVTGEGYGLGIVFERMVGSTLAQEVEASELSVEDCAHMLGELLARLHGVRVDPASFEDQRTVFAGYARKLAEPGIDVLTREEAGQLAALYEALPQGAGFVHGDFHAGNVMHDASGRLALIDLEGAGCGHPLLDWSGTWQAYDLIPSLDPNCCAKYVGISADKALAMLDPMLRAYLGTDDESQLIRWSHLMEAFGYAKYACMIARDPNPWIDRPGVAQMVREHVLAHLDDLLAELGRIGVVLSN